ncbi:hypothetical protein [Terrimicrobium sacchariphilum]|nr:hypothetical protein [Terrimicrobium sacchariphilum]
MRSTTFPLMRIFWYGLASVLVFIIGFGSGSYIRGQQVDSEVELAARRMVRAFAAEGVPPEQVVKRITEVGSGLEQGSQPGALAAMRAIDFIEQSKPRAAKEILSMVIVSYYNTHGPSEAPKYYVNGDGKEMLKRIQEFSEEHPDLKQRLR